MPSSDGGSTGMAGWPGRLRPRWRLRSPTAASRRGHRPRRRGRGGRVAVARRRVRPSVRPNPVVPQEGRRAPTNQDHRCDRTAWIPVAWPVRRSRPGRAPPFGRADHSLRLRCCGSHRTARRSPPRRTDGGRPEQGGSWLSAAPGASDSLLRRAGSPAGTCRWERSAGRSPNLGGEGRGSLAATAGARRRRRPLVSSKSDHPAGGAVVQWGRPAADPPSFAPARPRAVSTLVQCRCRRSA